MGSLTENKRFILNEWKTNLMSSLSQKRLESCLTFFWAKDENFPMKGSLKYLVSELLVDCGFWLRLALEFWVVLSR